VDANKLVSGMSDLLRRTLGEDIAIETVLAGGLWRTHADPNQLENVILNLAVNARDAMPAGGKLTIETANAHLDEAYAASRPEVMPGQYVLIAVCDTGSGMSPEVMARAFEPFFTTKEVGKGTGLGLSMVYGMARQSGGTARIESTIGEGTSVKMYFRAADAATLAEGAVIAGEETEGAAHGGPASILVIDDDPDVRDFIVTTLEEQGYRVRQASDGERGLKEAARAKPDLVILDFVMPGLSGSEVANRLLAKRPDQPILFVSGYSETEAVRGVAPNVPLLAKPFRAEALDKAVRNALAPSA